MLEKIVQPIAVRSIVVAAFVKSSATKGSFNESGRAIVPWINIVGLNLVALG